MADSLTALEQNIKYCITEAWPRLVVFNIKQNKSYVISIATKQDFASI